MKELYIHTQFEMDINCPISGIKPLQYPSVLCNIDKFQSGWLRGIIPLSKNLHQSQRIIRNNINKNRRDLFIRIFWLAIWKLIDRWSHWWMERGCNNQSLRTTQIADETCLKWLTHSLKSNCRAIVCIQICTAIELIDYMVLLTPQQSTRIWSWSVEQNRTKFNQKRKTKSVHSVCM